MEPLRSQRLVLRALREEDLDDLAGILSEPEVARWWPGYARERVRRELLGAGPELTVLALEHEGRVIGAIQFEEETDPQYRHASMDLFLGPRWWGQGLAQEAIAAVVEHLVRAGHHRLVIDPAADNARAIAAYEKLGFRRVGTLRSYERAPDGSWRDGLLMERIVERPG